MRRFSRMWITRIAPFGNRLANPLNEGCCGGLLIGDLRSPPLLRSKDLEWIGVHGRDLLRDSLSRNRTERIKNVDSICLTDSEVFHNLTTI